MNISVGWVEKSVQWHYTHIVGNRIFSELEYGYCRYFKNSAWYEKYSIEESLRCNL